MHDTKKKLLYYSEEGNMTSPLSTILRKQWRPSKHHSNLRISAISIRQCKFSPELSRVIKICFYFTPLSKWDLLWNDPDSKRKTLGMAPASCKHIHTSTLLIILLKGRYGTGKQKKWSVEGNANFLEVKTSKFLIKRKFSAFFEQARVRWLSDFFSHSFSTIPRL